MLNCFVSSQAFIWVSLFFLFCESDWRCVHALKPSLTRLPACACWPLWWGMGWDGLVGVLVDAREGCGY